MSEHVACLSDPFIKGLACAVLSPGLRSILVFDIHPLALQAVAETLKQMLEVVEGHTVNQASIRVFEADDELLWGSYTLSRDTNELLWQQGLLTGDRNYSRLELLVIPDLTQLSLSLTATRACVMLMGADIAHLERHGQHTHWQPNICWLAACDRTAVGQVSPHLLDRFALRLSGWSANDTGKNTDRVAEILALFSNQKSVNNSFRTTLSADDSRQLREAVQQLPEVTTEATIRISNYILVSETYSPRREIALARLALANAQLDGALQMTVDHVDEAARMIGLKLLARQTKKLPQESHELLEPSASQPESSKPSEETKSAKSSLSQPDSSEVNKSVYESAPPESFPSTSLPYPELANPYPEDEAPVEREAASLRLPSRHYRAVTAAQGSVIGVERAATLHDLALVNTLLEAAKFQSIRRKNRQFTNSRLLLSSTDLRSYRRSYVPEQLLVLLLDYTCLRDCNWQEALFPYLKWAYVERASICLIQVGWYRAVHELRAEKVTARSILVPRIGAALEESTPGKATPLAHGLDLAIRTLRNSMQHGRSAVQYAQFIVISDGRGNVPLEASHAGKITRSVNREGVDDALQVAQQIHSLDNVKSILLNPQPQQYSELPLTLAGALRAKTIPISLQEVEKV